ncbi:MAG: winged helix-turn-helix domain-containing protein, partial [Planctomycetota bacterium]
MTTSKTADARHIADQLEHRILTGAVREGEYLSSVRMISREFACAPVTAHRALRQLAEKGLVVAEPRHGYRVAGPGEGGGSTETIAFLEHTTGYEGYLGDIYEAQLSVLRRGSSA